MERRITFSDITFYGVALEFESGMVNSDQLSARCLFNTDYIYHSALCEVAPQPRMTEYCRSAHGVAVRLGKDEAITVNRRTTMIRYRNLFDELI